MTKEVASVDDIRLSGMMLHALTQVWAGKLGGGPQEGSVLARDRLGSKAFATERMQDPVSQLWAFAQTLGNVAANHHTILRESLLRFADGQASKPVTVVTRLARAVLETLSVQTWLIDPSLSTRDRVVRWMALEYQSELAAWRVVDPGASRLDNPVARQLVVDAQALDLEVGGKSGPDWIGTKVPTSTELAGLLVQRYDDYAGGNPRAIASMGEAFYRLFSGETHGSVGSVLALLMPTGDVTASGHQVRTYELSHGALWRSVCIVLMTTFAAYCAYAEWLGLPVDPEARRLHTHHVDLAVRKVAAGR